MDTSLSKDLLELSIAERIQLVEDLWDSVAQNADAVPITSAQQAELDRRLARLEAGGLEGGSWDEVKNRLAGK
jgi:putative addiction module component (TIGR02574 family)